MAGPLAKVPLGVLLPDPPPLLDGFLAQLDRPSGVAVVGIGTISKEIGEGIGIVAVTVFPLRNGFQFLQSIQGGAVGWFRLPGPTSIPQQISQCQVRPGETLQRKE